MRSILAMVALIMFTVTTSPTADAKRFGGGKSFGKSFKTAPAPKQAQQNTNSLKKDPSQASTGSKRGLLGGLMGGLLAGGLLAAFFGGAFDGIQFMDILIIGLIAYFGFKFLRGILAAKAGGMNQQAYSTAGHQNSDYQRQSHQQTGYQQNSDSSMKFQASEQAQSSTGFGSAGKADVPHNFAPGFDQAALINGAREHYRILQGAWNHNELNTIEEYVSASLYQDLKAERAQLQGEQHTDVMYVDAEIVRADYDGSTAQLSLQFNGRYRDAVEGIEEDINDVWHLERDLTIDNAPWLIVGIQA
ncbi:TIM44-like domain-containing protein [Vibrio sp. TH_r3]|uniref:Tim44 domain-containing protein n=1 Tax=Vibrio sp. TH_r3 TaxID=3082084 RepID=UPI002954BF49|nr:TIM44-like domain-containing protein [Vibrio sp. TH_r3]MDV7103991.1 TIM44-like domain-containing protein [Vibrio sp. TH_r3]